MNKHLILTKLGACSEAVNYAKRFQTLKSAWQECERGDWMLWFAGKLSGEPESDKRKRLVLASCECARLALPYTKDPRILKCIETAEAWAKGKATIEELKAARKSAEASYAEAAYADAYAYADAASAADAAAYAASAYDDAAAAYAASAYDDAAASAATAACAAAAAYAEAAYADAYASNRKKNLKKCADIVRSHYPELPR